uniref:Exostosin GT47 domain-containing protein n=1 Tax=Zosterops lateralis melanops TaxID=1220523 RepID=A0A8D2QMV1_ZOSLA
SDGNVIVAARGPGAVSGWDTGHRALLCSRTPGQSRKTSTALGRAGRKRGFWPRWTDRTLLRSFADPEELQRDGDPALLSPRERRAAWLSVYKTSRCRMETCFDFSRCERHGFKVFTYPQERGQPVSETYSKILSSIERSRYHTPNPEEACLFILSIDTLDRDHLSAQYVRNVDEKIRGFPLWNGGRNHLIFNLYSGTWPGYTGELGFDIGQAILAKASFDTQSFRPGFDVSIPLGWLYQDSDWEKHKDTRCDKDNVDYERFDYQELLHNSTFCIVPRGRRLGSFRFLEALQAACIPVLLSDGWELPFSEAIDWGKAAVVGSERLLLQVPAPDPAPGRRVLAFQQQTQFLWDAYFSSVDKIVHTTLEVSPPPRTPLPSCQGHSRGAGSITRASGRSSRTGCLRPAPAPASSGTQAPTPEREMAPERRAPDHHPGQEEGERGRRQAGIWDRELEQPPHSPTRVLPPQLSDRFFPFEAIQTDAVLSLDEDTSLSTSEVDFAFSVWRSFPERIVGFPTQSHFWDPEQGRWGYTSKWTNELSIVLTAAAFYHRYPAGRGCGDSGDNNQTQHPPTPPCARLYFPHIKRAPGTRGRESVAGGLALPAVPHLLRVALHLDGGGVEAEGALQPGAGLLQHLLRAGGCICQGKM